MDSNGADMSGPSDGSPTDEAALNAFKTEGPDLHHELLRANDEIAGLRAELATVRARLEVMDSTDVGIAFARVDELEDERQAMLHELRWTISSGRKELESVRSSTTWRVGNLVVRPINRITRRRPR